MTRGKPAETCGDHGGRRNDGSPCGRAAGWGTDFDTGRCRNCRGTNPDGTVSEDRGAPEGNDNAASHELYSDSNLYYQRRSDDQQAIIDAIYQDYRERYETLHGDPPTGDDARLFKIAVNIHKELRADDWLDARPETLDSGHPLIDRSEKRTAEGQSYYEYVESAVLKAESRLSRMTRMWLKDLGLLNDPDSQQADAEEDIADALREVLQ